MRRRLRTETDGDDARDQQAAGRAGNPLTARARVGARREVASAGAARPPTRDAGVAGRSEVGRLAGQHDDTPD